MTMPAPERPLAVVTGASTGIGLEMAKLCAGHGFDGFEAMMRGDADVVSGWGNKVRTILASITPSTILAAQHRKMTQPGSGLKAKTTAKTKRARGSA